MKSEIWVLKEDIGKQLSGRGDDCIVLPGKPQIAQQYPRLHVQRQLVTLRAGGEIKCWPTEQSQC